MLELLLSIYLGFLSVLGTAPAETGVSDPVSTSTRTSTSAGSYSAMATATARVVRVVDGDTIDVRFSDGWEERVRYLGIDAPEVYGRSGSECFSDAATAANRSLVAGEMVQLERDDENRDPYDRLLRYVYVKDTSVNAALLGSGHARLLFIPPNTRHYGAYSDVAHAARREERGLWGTCR